MQTERIAHYGSSPSTSYHQGADIVAQSQSGNYTILRVSATCFNRGNTSSYHGGAGYHTAAVDGIGQSQVGPVTLPSGYGAGAVRWDQWVDLHVPHDSAGNRDSVILRQTVNGWGHTNVQAVALGGFARIPKPPTAPGTPVASEILPTSVRLTWKASSNNNGSAITGYRVRRWDNAQGTGSYTDHFANDLSRVMSGLTPGKEYRFVVYARNGSYGQWSPASAAVVVRTLSGMWIKHNGSWKRAAPYVKVAGVWKAASVFIKSAGTWKRGG